MTVFTGFWLSRVLAYFDLMICPQLELTFSHPHCEPTLPFIPVPYHLPSILARLYFPSTVTISPIQWHGVLMAVFASIIAPFGGFFASGFKRAFKIKDFGASIPGHGGVTDRMDCQLLNGLFVYVYHTNFVRTTIDTSTIFQLFLKLSSDQQLYLHQMITKHLVGSHLLPA